MKEGQFEILDYNGEETIQHVVVDLLIHKLNFHVRDLQDNNIIQMQTNKRVGMQIIRLMLEPLPKNPLWRRLLRLSSLPKPPLNISITRCDSRGAVFPKYCVERIAG